MDMNNRPLISIIVPVYNTARYLEKCVQSICNQTYSKLEILLVDDGSTDSSGALCDKLSSQDSRIRVLHKENGGSSSARNHGIEHAHGQYMGFVDSDDYLEADMYENLLAILEAHSDASIAQCMSRDYAEDGTLLKDGYRLSGKTVCCTNEEYYRDLMLYTGDSSFCTKLIPTDFMKQYRFPVGKLNEDFGLLLEMLSALNGVYTIEKVGYNILIRQGSNQRTTFHTSMYHAILDNAKLSYNMMLTTFPQYQEEATRFVLGQDLIYLLHVPVEQMVSTNVYYMQVLKDLRTFHKDVKKNPYLRSEERRNLRILRIAPKTIRRLHRLSMLLRGKL